MNASWWYCGKLNGLQNQNFIFLSSRMERAHLTAGWKLFFISIAQKISFILCKIVFPKVTAQMHASWWYCGKLNGLQNQNFIFLSSRMERAHLTAGWKLFFISI